MRQQQSCEICNAPAFKYHRLNDIDLFKCSNCKFIFSDRNKKTDFNYQTDFYVEVAENSKKVHEFYAEARLNLIRKYKENMDSLLDVGCSSGIFLDKVNHNVKNAKGIELSAEAVEQAKRKGLNVELKSVFEEDSNYDVITLIEVMEHFTDLNLLLNQLYELLNRNGIIYFQTGTTSSLQFLLKRKRWHYFDPPAHCSYLGKKSTKMLLKNHNFKILYIGAGVDWKSYLTTKNKPYNTFAVLKGLIGKFQLGGYTIPSTIGVLAQKL